ncbi:MAG: hypothetical protein K0U98_20935 [Deltaproteobacteria bacterium]|nr:hypothetical protein [Deltaproteobacteria bacterium]
MTAALIVIGALPTERLVGRQAFGAMVAGCCASLLASVIGALPVLLASAKTQRPIVVAFGAMALRLAVIVGLGLVLLLSGGFPRGPLLMWIGISYVVLLPLDTRFVMRSAIGANAEAGLERT